MQVRDSRPAQGFSIIQLLGATATDGTRQDRTPFAVACSLQRLLSQTAEERSGAAGNGKEWWDGD